MTDHRLVGAYGQLLGVFHSLNKEHIRKILDLILNMVTKPLTEKNIKLEVTDAAKEFLISKGYDPAFGARPLRRVVQDHVEDLLSEGLLRGDYHSGDTVTLDSVDDKIVARPVLQPVSSEKSK